MSEAPQGMHALNKEQLVHILLGRGLLNMHDDAANLVKIIQLQRALNVKLDKRFEEQFKELVSIFSEAYDLFKEQQDRKDN